MPLPFVLAAIGVAAGAYGVKRGLDAKENMDKAKEITQSAQKLADRAKYKLESAQENTRDAIVSLGRKKIEVLGSTVKDFIENYGKIKNINLRETEGIEELKYLNLTKESFRDLKNASYEALDIASNGLASVAGGTLMAYGSYSAVALLGTASTGTAIGGLSGVAATNATLAWLGGGSLAAGGFGVAGGMMVLGGLVAGPALAIGGSIFASQAEKALNDAESNYDKAVLFETETKKICTTLKGIANRAEKIEEVLDSLDDYLAEYVYEMKEIIIGTGSDWNDYDQDEKHTIFKCAMIAQTEKKLLDTSLLSDSGELTEESRTVLQDTKKFLQASV